MGEQAHAAPLYFYFMLIELAIAFQFALAMMILIVIVLYVLAYRLSRKLRIGANLSIKPMVLSEQSEMLRNYFNEHSDACSKLGFTEIMDLKIDGLLPNRCTSVRFMFKRSSQEVAGAVITRTQHSDGKVEIKKYSGFATVYHDGRTLITTNTFSRIPTQLIESEDWMEVAIPGEEDMDKLYEIHHVSAHEFARGAMRELPKRDNWVIFLRHILRTPFEVMCRVGRLRFDAAEEVYSPTLWGAIQLIINESWPFKQRRIKRIERRARRLVSRIRS